MSLKRSMLATGLAAAIAGIGYFGYKNTMKAMQEPIQEAYAGMKAPEFSFKAEQDGRDLSSQSLEDRTVLLDFWATWCGPCKALTPHIEELYKECKDDGLEVIQVATKDSRENLEAYLAKTGYPGIPMAFDEDSEVANRYGVRGLPLLVLIQKGVVKDTCNFGYGEGTFKWLKSIKNKLKKK